MVQHWTGRYFLLQGHGDIPRKIALPYHLDHLQFQTVALAPRPAEYVASAMSGTD